MKKIGLFLLCLWCCVWAAFAARAENFYIENYEVMLDVSKNRLVHVKEVITVYFTTPSHGIILKIPAASSSINNVQIFEPFSKSYQLGDLNLKIGDVDRLISGEKVYHIEFNHQLYSNKNEFYYNLIGTGWDVPIQKVRFYVKMPDAVEDDKVGLSIGTHGTRGFEGGAEYSVSGNEIWGRTFRTLSPHEGITLRAEVPEGYFENVQNKWVNIVWLGLLLCTLFSFLTWYQYGKDEHVTPVVTFEAPAGVSGAEAELILSEKISDKGLVALIVNLANDGCFKITSNKKKFTLSDFKSYRGYNELERRMLTLLESQKRNGVVTDDILKNSDVFYRGWSHFKEASAVKDERKRYYEASSMNPLRKFMMFLYICGNVLLTFFALINYEFSPENLSILVPLGITLWVLVMVLSQPNIVAKLFGTFTGVMILIPIIVEFSHNLSINNLSQVVMGAACIISSLTCYVQMMKPNIEGRLLKGKLLGLKHFIEVAEKKRLETMVTQNHQYFYKILPYAYVLGVSSVWIKQFEGIAVPPPKWATDDGFSLNNFNNFTRGFNATTAPSVANGGISQSSSHSSSGGGGGFSGGGFGGGGGSSW